MVALVSLLAAVAVADVLALGMRERAVELVTLRVMGWSDGQLGRLVLVEAAAVAVLGAGSGATVGTLGALLLGVTPAPALLAGALAAATGAIICGIASLGPAVGVARLPFGVASAEA